MTVSEIQNLLKLYASIPKRKVERTFMEVCNPPRFEEVCSRILCFFLDPNAEHGFGDLLLTSFLHLSGHEGISYNADAVKVWTEEHTDENKRIDILIESPEMIIGIENKIYAELYNPLDSYRKHMLAYKKAATVNLVLSLRHLSEPEIDHAKRNEHQVIYYENLIEDLEGHIGSYLTKANPLWVTHLLDFIKTIKNRINNLTMDKEYRFFIEHKDEIAKLVERYQAFEDNNLRAQREYIGQLEPLISERCGQAWWVFEGWDLGISWNDNQPNRIGIESSFQANQDGPTGEFHIYITTWKRKDWVPYEEDVLETFQVAERNLFLDRNAENSNRVYLHLPVLHNPTSDQIIDALYDAYVKMVGIVARVDFRQ